MNSRELAGAVGMGLWGMEVRQAGVVGSGGGTEVRYRR